MLWIDRFGGMFLAGVLFLNLFSSAPARGESITVLTEHSPPGEYLDDQGRVTGPTAELVRELLQRVGHSGKISLVPWARGYMTARRGPKVALFETTRTELREHQFKWVGPIKRIAGGLFVRSEDDVSITNLEEARNLDAICVYRGSSGAQALSAMGFTNLEQPTHSAQCLDMLMHGRVDAWMTSDIARGPLFAETPYSENEVRLAYATSTKYLYIALSLDVPDSTVALWQNTLDQMKLDGTLARYYRGTYPDDMIEALSQPEYPDVQWAGPTGNATYPQ
ncbi:MAG: ABC transporter substrate-binding protein [Pseudomonadota bacterium]|uniref:substrate-binding periplasmic protein n=1 Tax=Marinobacter sp. TaxID=50741 RepID=UPI002E87D4BC|nr:ABC transporter substrate-binding protein [Pseudomonadota bacterium]